jgi:hypothetical protein
VAGGSVLRSGHTQVGEPKIGEHALTVKDSGRELSAHL